MYIPPLGGLPARARAEPANLLSDLAGEFALRIERLWPEPHAEFVTAPAPRRHLVCIAFALGHEVRGMADLLLDGRMGQAVAAVAGDRAPGLQRALDRLGEAAWPAQGYRNLLALLAEPKAAKILRHAVRIDLDLVARLGALPTPMAEAAHLALTLDLDQLAMLQESYDILRFRLGEAEAAEVAASWTRFETAKALFAGVWVDLCPEPPAPPHPGTTRLRPLATRAELRDAAQRYRNCLEDYLPYASAGLSAFYEWTGTPGAILEISRDAVFGWRLDHARMAGNAPVPSAMREEIICELALLGVYVGRTGWELQRVLQEAGHHRHGLRPAAEVMAEVFGAE